MRFLFLFLDGVGLGGSDPAANPFAGLHLPTLQSLLGGRRMVLDAFSANGAATGNVLHEGERATLLALDASLGVDGLPQSASGQATLLSGENIPAALGYHYGPKPNPAIVRLLSRGTLFSRLRAAGRQAALLNAYPPGYFEAIHSGRRMYSAIPLAVNQAGIPLKTHTDLQRGEALAADFTARGWHDHLGLRDTPLLEPVEAGRRLAQLACRLDFAFFEYWLSDYAGHHQDLQAAREILTTLDQVLEGLLEAWDDDQGLVLLTSDHGNLEDLSTRRHTANPVPALLIGSPALRRAFTAGLHDLTGVAPAILRLLGVPAGPAAGQGGPGEFFPHKRN